MQPLTFTDSAIAKIKDILVEETPGTKLRVFVQGGGCAGFTQGFTLDEVAAGDDFVSDFDGVQVLVDAMSMQYLDGASVDYVSDLMSAQFVIKNPNSTGKCGCGSSFSV